MKAQLLTARQLGQLKELRAAWLTAILLPLPAMIFWHSQDGRCVALWCFCAGCFGLAASSFRRTLGSDRPFQPWSQRILALAAALLLAWVAFSLLWIFLVDPHDLVALFIGLQILLPSFCVVPYLTLITRKAFAAIMFSAFLLGCMKGVAGVAVNLVYGWGDGHHELPWTAPNLMLSAFWIASVILCLSCYFLGARRFRIQFCKLG